VKKRPLLTFTTVALCQNIPSYLRSFAFHGVSVMPESPTFDHSARLEPAIPGFPVLISRFSSYKGWSRVYLISDATMYGQASSNIGCGIM